MKKRDYLQKDVTELTSQDLAEMLEDYNAAIENREEINKELADLQKKQAALMVNLAIFEAMAESVENMKAGATTALDAFGEYAKERGGTVRGFFSDPDLPEILRRIRDRAIEKLREQTAENDAKEKPEKEPWQEMLDALKGEKTPLKGTAYLLHDSVTKALLDQKQVTVNKKHALPALPRDSILSYVHVIPKEGQQTEAEEERALDYGEWGYLTGYIRIYHSDRKNKIFTPAMLYRAANGIEDRSYVTENQEDEARAFMTWCHTHDIIIDKRAEYRRRLEIATEKGDEKELDRLKQIIGNPEKLGLIKDTLLDFVEHIDPDLFKETGEVKAICWEPGRPPALEQSALISGQLTSTPAEVLDIREVKQQKNGLQIIGRRLRNSRERMNIKFYLLDAVRIRKAGKNLPITLEDLIRQGLPGHAAGKKNEPTVTDTKRRYYREYARDVLTYWQAIGHIKNFRYVRGKEHFIINEEPEKDKMPTEKKSAITQH